MPDDKDEGELQKIVGSIYLILKEVRQRGLPPTVEVNYTDVRNDSDKFNCQLRCFNPEYLHKIGWLKLHISLHPRSSKIGRETHHCHADWYLWTDQFIY